MPIPLLPPDDASTPFPSVEHALDEPNGLLMAGGSLRPARLLVAYRHGIFPWYSAGEPVLWWSPDPRCVLWPRDLKVSRSLAKSLRNRGFEVRHDTAFRDVIERCAALRSAGLGTWISPEMLDVYCLMHELGYAHSVECWQRDELVGGLYGVRLDRVFFGESMFSTVRDASKVALVHLCRDAGLALIDCQLTSPHLLSLGAHNMPRREFITLLHKYVQCT
jgi:leucyl/phenylalanyl-tRNA--protein transferase